MSSHNSFHDAGGGHEHSLLLVLQATVKNSLWHLAFFPALRPSSHIVSAVKAHSSTSSKAADNSVVVSALHSLALLEAVGYTEAGHTARRLWRAHAFGSTFSLSQHLVSAEQWSWVDKLRVTALRHAEDLSSTLGSGEGVLATLLAEAQKLNKQDKQTTACDALFSELAHDYLEHIATATSATSTVHASKPAASAESNLGVPRRRTTSIFQYEVLPAQAAAARQRRQWYEARLYAAVACSTSISTPGPLARLLVAYAHQGDRRLQVAAGTNLECYIGGDHNGEKTKEGGNAAPVTSVATDTAAAALARVRLSGVVAGVVEYALCVARVRTAVAVAELRASASAVNASPEQPPPCTVPTSCAVAHVPHSAALLLSLITEECSYYQQTAPAGTGGGEVGVTAAVLHAVQELLFTVVLGGGTQHMHNRPEPPAPPKRPGADGGGGASVTPVVMAMSTTRGVTLPEADAIAQEFFPALVQQLGMEWVWSPLLRHLASLDKSQVSAEAIDARAGSTPVSSLSVRWSSHVLMDTILLSLSRKTYPQRLLNVLPGSYERLLSNLDLLPQIRPRGDDGDDAGKGDAARRASGPLLFGMPAYYAEPASALVAYFQRAGVSGLRIEETERILTTATSIHAMVVRLRAQAPSRHDADGREDGADDRSGEELDGNGKSCVASLYYHNKTRATPHAYALTHERVEHLITRYQGEVLLAAVVVHTQLRVPSQVQQLMRVLAPLFLKIHLAWRTHHDGSSASWLLQPRTDPSVTGTTPSAARFSAEAAVLLDEVGYEFYPLEWLPAALAASTATSDSSVERLAFPYSLLAAVGHQFQLQLRGIPLGSSGDVTLRHPAGPRTSAVMPSVGGAALIASCRGGDEEETKSTAAAWRRTERFVTGLMQLCYLDPKTSSTELEGTLAVSSTRRVLTTSGGSATLGSSGGGSSALGVRGSRANVIAAADVASHRLRSLVLQPAVMDAMWGSMENTAITRGNGASQRYGERREKRSRSVSASAEAQEHLRSMQQLLQEYGAASFDTTVEAADFALMIAQAFLPLSVGTSASLSSASGKAGPAASAGKKSEALLRAGLGWGSAVVGHAATKARVHMQLQQQQKGGVSSFSAALAHVYNSATVDTAWLARSALRYVPQRIWEKMCAHRAERLALVHRHSKWVSRLLGDLPTASEAKQCDVGDAHRVDPLLVAQWTQWERVLEQLGLSEHLEGSSAAAASAMPRLSPFSAEDITCAQWLWYSPYFAAEMAP
ncbi:CBP110 / nuclear cap binding complex subunit CBP110 [Leishmania donovani]|uniref:Nuclear_cap_binding_complex_subunit_CBP110_putati ve/GeneDB:LmjF.34.0590 n=1 Tax=Leishmania donovani TaxID=5661 RepID=A0A6J8FMW5_LEIDO|nr:CBP110 / nuclear cap binding complex subunit CBP110 [Leishmania donovani]VDZ48238.1 nuclear_cap_binding_complex_subunit_CBP110_putative/GeneDB:LmjF.34.0590 [Leishmania donovani]